MALDFNSDVDFVDQNTHYMDELYALDKNRFDNWHIWCIENLETTLDSYTIPAGKTVMAGTWNGNLYKILQSYSGPENCAGFDIVNYYDDAHQSIVYGDFRDIHANHNQPVAIFYNGLGTWENNKRSKQAGLDYALANLVPNGIYLEPYTAFAAEKLSTTQELQVLEPGRLIVCKLL